MRGVWEEGYALSGVERMKLPLASEARRSSDQKLANATEFARVSAALTAGGTL